MNTTEPITKPSSISEQLTESIQKSLQDHGINKARVTLELLGRNTEDPHRVASGVSTAKPDNNDVEVIILNHDGQEDADGNMNNTSVNKENSSDSKIFMYSSEVIGTNKEQPFTQLTEIKNNSPAYLPDSADTSKDNGEKECIYKETEKNLVEKTSTPMNMSGHGANPASGQPTEPHERVMLPNEAPSEQAREAEGEQPAFAADDPKALEAMAMMMDEGLLPDDVRMMMEREKNKKERIRILNTFLGKSVLLDYKKAQGHWKSSPPPPISSTPFMSAAMRTQVKRSSKVGEQSNEEGEAKAGISTASSTAPRTPKAGAGGIQVLRFTLPADNQARLDAVEQLRGSAAGEQHISAKDKYRLMMDDQQQILKRNDTSQDEYKRLLDKAIEYNRSLMQ
ncbi:unnamed protein product [Phytomonas sp. EM1]|nr:unnamed protein product [Phytomonas sp. EM1]|eukprot:CCW63973.1 unnamed protein product [Phytomonas sp. isolate EM1]